jgi:2-phosphosulfolactate phosphatase
VVFDVLRATTSMITALAHGAEAVIPVEEIADALALRQERPDVLLAGERNGLRIGADLTGGPAFDLGNSPREYSRERVYGRTIVTTTTNGTRALRACLGARRVLAGAILNLDAVAQWLLAEAPAHLILVCSGTHEEPAFEDLVGAGAVCEAVWTRFAVGHVSDSALVCRQVYSLWKSDLIGAARLCRNGRRLLAHPDLRDDVAFCLQRDAVPVLAELHPDGAVRLCRAEAPSQ